jgi:heterodisulfide reductase subunit A
MVSEVNPALCQGCGTCVAGCPAGAISGTGFSNLQILSQIDGLLLLTLDKKKEAVVA